MIIEGNNVLLFIHPKKPASKEPIKDKLTKAISFLVKNRSKSVCVVLSYKKKNQKNANIDKSGSMTLGTHQCTAGCDERSRGYDMEIEIDGKKYYTNYLAYHYVAFHREEVPKRDLELLEKVKVPEDFEL